MLHRVKKTIDENKDKWIGIGGKFEQGESPEDCMLREVREETGLSVHSWQYRGIVTFVSDEWGTEYMHLFRTDDFSGRIKKCDEGELEWIDKQALLNLPIWEGDKIFLRLLDTDEPFFSLKLCKIKRPQYPRGNGVTARMANSSKRRSAGSSETT